jgi:outer membrane protein
MHMNSKILSTLIVSLMCGGAPAWADTLQEALARAYQTNPQLTGARAGQKANDENVPLQLATARPSADIASTASNYLDNPSIALPDRSSSTTGTLTVPIYSGGATRNAITAARLRVESGQKNLLATEASIFSRVVAAYMDVIRDSALVRLNTEFVNQLQVNLKASKDRYEVGDITRTDVAQSQSRLELAISDAELAQANLISSKERYIALVGVPPENLESPPALPNMPASPEMAVATALRDNPDILASKIARNAARYDVKVAKAQVLPRVSVFTQGSYTNYLGSQKDIAPALRPDASVKSATVGARLSLPLYQGGRPGALTRQSAARESQAIENEIAIERDVIAQTRSAYASWQASLQAIESRKAAISSTALSLEGVRAENSVGSRTILDILNAQQEALNARVQLVIAQRNAYVAGFSLLAAMGRAQAKDLGLDGGALYDPNVNYAAVDGKLNDLDFGSTPQPIATRTAGTPAQDAKVITAQK